MGDISLKTLKMALLGATFLIGAAGAASAADVYNKGGSYKDAPGEYMPAITWTGLYFGINAGAAFTDEDTSDNDETVFVGGVHLGYNWQKHGPWVFGIEGDVDFADDVDYVATIRGRLGFAAGNTLFYGTAGAAFLGAEDSFGDDDTLEGWVAGLGLEHKFTQNVSAGLEGLYYNYGEIDGAGSDEDLDTWTVRARLTYHLGGDRYGDALK